MELKWQPIETAPKDGRLILLYRPDAMEWMKVTVGRWNKDNYAIKVKRPYWHSFFKIGTIREWRQWAPTHWMPILIPPPVDE